MSEWRLIYIITTGVMIVCFSWVIWAYTTKFGTVDHKVLIDRANMFEFTKSSDKPNPNTLTSEQLQYLAEDIIQGEPITDYEREVVRLWQKHKKRTKKPKVSNYVNVMPLYDINKQYTVTDTIEYNNSFYECIKDCIGVLPIFKDYWFEVFCDHSIKVKESNYKVFMFSDNIGVVMKDIMSIGYTHDAGVIHNHYYETKVGKFAITESEYKKLKRAIYEN